MKSEISILLFFTGPTLEAEIINCTFGFVRLDFQLRFRCSKMLDGQCFLFSPDHYYYY